MLPRTLIEFVYTQRFLTRRVNNNGDISWHKDRVFIAGLFRYEDLGFELVAEDFYKVFFRDFEIGEFDVEAPRFRPDLRQTAWIETALFLRQDHRDERLRWLLPELVLQIKNATLDR